jgi:hypothetical protein
MCPRGDLNPQGGEISPNRGNHAIRVTAARPTRQEIPRSVRYLSRHPACAWLWRQVPSCMLRRRRLRLRDCRSSLRVCSAAVHARSGLPSRSVATHTQELSDLRADPHRLPGPRRRAKQPDLYANTMCRHRQQRIRLSLPDANELCRSSREYARSHMETLSGIHRNMPGRLLDLKRFTEWLRNVNIHQILGRVHCTPDIWRRSPLIGEDHESVVCRIPG